MATNEEYFDLTDAYSVETPEDNVDLYARWANTYESGFVADEGYVYHHGVAEVFLENSISTTGSILDVGCGTGLVGGGSTSKSSWNCRIFVF